MKYVDNLFYKFSPKLRERFFYLRFLKEPIKTIRSQFKIKEYYKNSKYGLEKDKKNFYKTIKRVTLKTSDGLEFAKCFYGDEIKIVKETKIDIDKPILICLIKNDIIRLKKFIEHYKKIGIENFVFIDNDSTDGTFEFLKNLQYINLFQTKEKYTTIRRQAWINKIISYYGYNRWYLILDSDELLVYDECENKNINDLIIYLKNNNIKRARALMVDMYSDEAIFSVNLENDSDFTDKYCYFDVDTYEQQKHKFFELVTGGMRKRIFDKYSKMNPFLTKYPLIYFEKGDLQYNSHYSYPFYKNFNSEINLVILHYKFLPGDLEKIKTIIKEKNYALGSKQYVAYLKAYEANPNLKFKNSNSKKYIDSKDLENINIVKKIKW